MLNGIGGRTVEEAKERLSYEEALAWSAYEKKRGSLNLALHIERGFALIATQINHALRGNAEMADFMPHAEKQPATLADIAQLLGGKS